MSVQSYKSTDESASKDELSRSSSGRDSIHLESSMGRRPSWLEPLSDDYNQGLHMGSWPDDNDQESRDSLQVIDCAIRAAEAQTNEFPEHVGQSSNTDENSPSDFPGDLSSVATSNAEEEHEFLPEAEKLVLPGSPADINLYVDGHHSILAAPTDNSSRQSSPAASAPTDLETLPPPLYRSAAGETTGVSSATVPSLTSAHEAETVADPQKFDDVETADDEAARLSKISLGLFPSDPDKSEVESDAHDTTVDEQGTGWDEGYSFA